VLQIDYVMLQYNKQKLPLHVSMYHFMELQWNLFIIDTLGPAISGSFLLLYRGFPLSEVKSIDMVPLGL